MSQYTFGSVVLATVSSPKRGLCMRAWNTETDKGILFDIGGMDPNLVPDGTNGYFFGNKLLLITRWSDMTEEEMTLVQEGKITLGFHPYESIQFSLRIGKYLSGVDVTLPHCLSWLNDEEEAVDEVIFVFTDTHDNDFLVVRSATLPPFLAKRLMKANIDNHALFAYDRFETMYRMQAESDELRDFFDYVYDNCRRQMYPYYSDAVAKQYNVPDSIYVEVEDDEITNIFRLEDAVEEKMSDEVKMYLQFAEKGHAESQYNLGVCYETADGVEQDLTKAAYWYAKAAEQGYAKAQYNLGVCYHNGYGVEQNDEESLRLYLLAAEQGDMYAQFNAGVCYMQGTGTEANPFTALDYLQKAAEQGHPQAREFLQSIGLL